jgi:large subunit ribosomal protein L17
MARKLSRKKAHRDKLIRNLVGQVFEHGRIKTTKAKAKTIKPKIDKVITWAKKDTPASREMVEKYLFSKVAVENIYSKYKKDLEERSSGYSRIISLNNRHGDNSSMAIVDLLVSDQLKSSLNKRKEQEGEKKTDSEEKNQEQKQKGSFWDRFKGDDKKIEEPKKQSIKTDSTKKEPTQRTTSK